MKLIYIIPALIIAVIERKKERYRHHSRKNKSRIDYERFH